MGLGVWIDGDVLMLLAVPQEGFEGCSLTGLGRWDARDQGGDEAKTQSCDGREVHL